MAACPSCGEQNPERARFCSNCGRGLQPVGEAGREVRKTVTVVFTDVTGSTRLGDRLDPESMRRVMNRFFEEMKAVLEHHGGTVEKFIGDAVMAVFGVPTLHEDDALRAVRAAHEMREALASLNAELQRDRGISLLARTGVNTGEVVTGEHAGQQRLVTGDAVNVAARLEQAAQPGEVLIGESTWRLIRNAVEAAAIPPITVKGKDDPIDAYRLVDVRADAVGVAGRLDSPMVGRDRQLTQLRQAYEAAVADRACHLFTVLGSAGVGKSRLVLEFLRSLPSEAQVLRGRCLPYGEGITYWPVREILTEAANIDDGDSPDRVRQKLRSLLSRIEDDEALAERVALVFGLAEPSAPAEEISWAVRHLLEALAQDRPLVVVVDDIHWAEPTLLDLIEHVVDLARDAPILLLCIARPEVIDTRPGWGGGKLNATSILLEPLPEADTEVLIENILGQAALEESARSRITDAAGGNPLFVEEMLSMLIDEGLLARSNGHWESTTDLTEMKVPPTIQALLAARLDLLHGEERQVIERASVVGKVFYRDAVTELSPEPVRPRVPGHLTTLVRRELIRPERSETFSREETYRFRHILIRDAAYEGISKETRAELHEAVAEWLERTVGARFLEYEEIVAYHLEQAYRFRTELGPVDENARRLGERAASLLASSGRRALARTDLPACVNLLGRAVALLAPDDRERIELLIDVALALTDAGDYPRAETLVGEAIQAAEKANDARLRAHGVLVRLRLLLFTDPEGRADEIRREAERAIAIFEEQGDDQGLARAWNALAWAHWMGLRAAARQEALERAIEHARRAGDRGEELESIYYLPSPIVRGPVTVSEGLRRLDRILEEGGRSRKVESTVLWGKALLETMRGRFEEGREAAARCVAIAEDLGMKPQAAVAASEALGYLEMMAGDPIAAERVVRKGYEAMDQMGEKGILSTIASDLAMILCHQGRFQEAEPFVRICQESAASDDVASQVNWRAAMAEVLASRGRDDEAVELAREAVALIAQTDVITHHADTLMHLAEVLRTARRTEEVRDALEQALALYERKENVVGAERARRMLAELNDG